MPNQESSKRHQILSDAAFWGRLEFELTGWLRDSSDPLHRRYWIDGIQPEAIRDTRVGADVVGKVWMIEGKAAELFDFVIGVPQALLYHPSAEYVVGDVQIDDSGKSLRLVIERRQQG